MITHVAIIYEGLVYMMPKPKRHHDVIKFICDTLQIDFIGENIQGFGTDKNVFLDRIEAQKHALVCNQVLDVSKLRGQWLFSEDLW